jgi:hypothetical protein
MPHLRTTAGHDKVRVCWAGALDGERLATELADFRAMLAGRCHTVNVPAEGYLDGPH